jgi:FkbM family methyltransferase
MKPTLLQRLIRRSIRPLGLEIRTTRYNQDVLAFLADRRIDVVLDVGGNVGQFGQSLRAGGFRGKIVSFEPLSAPYRVLAANAVADGNWETHNFALGATPGTATINVSDASVFSSLLTSRPAATRHEAAAMVTGTETIQVRTLDTVVVEPSGNVLLKIDTQGYERQVLEGGWNTLGFMTGVLMELPIIHLYEQSWQFHEAIEFMARAGFVPAQIHPVNYHSADKVSLIEVDCLFRRRDPTLD